MEQYGIGAGVCVKLWGEICLESVRNAYDNLHVRFKISHQLILFGCGGGAKVYARKHRFTNN